MVMTLTPYLSPGLPGNPGRLGSELQQPGGRPLGDHGHVGQCQHTESGPQSDRECTGGDFLQPAQTGQVSVTGRRCCLLLHPSTHPSIYLCAL